jgi:hypothetical protein
MTFLLGVPAAAKIVVVQSKGWAAVYLLTVVWWQSPFGTPVDEAWVVLDTIVWLGAGAFGVWFTVVFVMLGKSAWAKALEVHKLISKFGVPTSEIL